jgi:general secretion pathway protein H
MTGLAHWNGRSAAGFTLLELLVVLAILGAASALILPRFGGSVSRVSMRSTAVQLVALLRATRSEAMRSNTELTVTIDLSGRAYWSDIQTGPRSIARGIDLTLSGAGIEWKNNAAVRVRFKPDGRASAAEIGLKEGKASAVITIDWLTGVSHLDWNG